MSRIGVMITSKCDFRCDHCMFSCTNHGRHMSQEVLSKVGYFIRSESDKIHEVNIYGGEPFIDMEHFNNCMDELYTHDLNFHISSNGSFLSSPKRFEAVVDWCTRKFTYNQGEASAIRISNTTFHKKNRSDLLERKIQSFEWAIKDPYSFADFFDMGDRDEESYYDIPNPLIWSDPSWHTHPATFYLDRPSSYEGINPSGRALTTNSYSSGRDHELSCVLTANSYEDFDELWNDMGEIEFYPNGDIGICCYCKSGTVGNIRDFNSVESVKNAVKRFRQHMRIKGKVNKNNMRDTCDNCRKCKVLQPISQKVVTV